MNRNNNFKPELLLPVGSAEAFYAALKSGADAIYLGLREFNARGRAGNFTPWQLAAIVKTAHKDNMKVYITLNVVIKNNEIKQLINTLFILDQIKPDAVIIQDWGVYFILKKFFPRLIIHASTQMANHNSTGVSFSAQKGFERVVLARELTPSELETIALKKKTELELFVHGALCYSFSGMCLFSSYMGGMGANRGMCTQPCRRIYKQNKNESYLFSLKDNQLIEYLPFIKKLRIDSLKIEGRLKPAEYVYRVSKAYRKALEHPNKINEAEVELKLDLGREKTDYFMGKQINNAITQSANTGLLIGKVIAVEEGKVSMKCSIEPEPNSRLRFRNKASDSQNMLKVPEFKKEDDIFSFETPNQAIKIGDEVYLAGLKMKLPQKIKTDGIKINDRCPAPLMKKALGSVLFKKPTAQKNEIHIRIDSIAWLRKIRFDDFKSVIINLSQSELEQFDPQIPFLQKFKKNIWIELPKFIAEKNISFYINQLRRIQQAGLNNFSISHLSQKELLPKGACYMTNENVYLFNDAAIKQIKSEGAFRFILPIENDIVNLAGGSNREGIIPVYFHPHLFYSRMPVKVENELVFSDKTGENFKKTVCDGITIILPENPVSLTQYKNKLEKYGFSRFLIDMSFTPPSKNTPITIKRRLLKSEQIQPSSNFNFKREMK
jgi:putative protease